MTTEAAQAAATQQSAAAPAVPATTATPPATSLPVAAPAAAPAAPAEATPAEPTKTPPAQGASETPGVFGAAVTYQPVGNQNLDLALKWAGQQGLDIEASEELKQAAKGNFGPLRALLAGKNVPGAEAYVKLAEDGFNELKAQREEHTRAVQAMVVEAAGSAEEWENVMQWARENAEPHERDAVNTAFEQGGFIAEAVAAHLVNSYRGQATTTVAPKADPVNPTAAAGGASKDTGPLSPQEYGRAVQQLRMKMGPNFEASPEYGRLAQRRMQYRG